MENDAKFIKECAEFGVLENWNGKVKIFSESLWLTIDEAVEKVEKFSLFDSLKAELERKKEYLVAANVFKTDSCFYTNLLEQAKTECAEKFPALYETIFGDADRYFLFRDSSGAFSLTYFNPYSIAGGSFVSYTFYEDSALRIFNGEPVFQVIDDIETTWIDINTTEFFDVLSGFLNAQNDNSFIGYVADVDDTKILLHKFFGKKEKTEVGKRGRPKSNVIGLRYGKLLIESYDQERNGYVICKCDCGNRKSIRANSLSKANKPTTSCGCTQKEIMSAIGKKTVHKMRQGLSETSLKYHTNFAALMSSDLPKGNKTGCKGVYLTGSKVNKYVAYIVVHKKNIYLGRFRTYEEAAAARKAAEEKYHAPLIAAMLEDKAKKKAEDQK